MKALSPKLFCHLLLFFAATFHLIPPTSAATATTKVPASADFIRSVCNETSEDADFCYSTISPYANVIKQNPNALCCVGVAVAQSVVRRVATSISSLSRDAKGSTVSAISDCVSFFGEARDLLSDSLGQLRQIATGKGGDFKVAINAVWTVVSGAGTYETTCTEEFAEEPEGPVKTKVIDLVTESENYTSIALSFVSYYAEKGSP